MKSKVFSFVILVGFSSLQGAAFSLSKRVTPKPMPSSPLMREQIVNTVIKEKVIDSVMSQKIGRTSSSPQRLLKQKTVSQKPAKWQPTLPSVTEEGIKLDRTVSPRRDTAILQSLSQGRFDDAAEIMRDVLQDHKLSRSTNAEILNSLNSVRAKKRAFSPVSFYEAEQLQSDFEGIREVGLALNYGINLYSSKMNFLQTKLKQSGITDQQRQQCQDKIDEILKPFK